MSSVFGNRRKPFRAYGAYNNLAACRLHVRQDGLIDPAEAKGTTAQIALTPNKNFHIGTIPAGAFILPAYAQVITPFAAGAVSIGPEDDIDGLVTPGDLGVGAAGFKSALTGGALIGYTDRDLELFARLDAASATGEFDVVIPFYVHAD